MTRDDLIAELSQYRVIQVRPDGSGPDIDVHTIPTDVLAKMHTVANDHLRRTGGPAFGLVIAPDGEIRSAS